MPVLDAKALEIDPQGAAFLKSVLRPITLPPVPPKETPRTFKVRFHIMRRTRELASGMA
jgi:hypothetical protein